MSAVDLYFNPAAFFIIFREALEAAIILAVLLQYINFSIRDTGFAKKLKRSVWLGTGTALLLSIILGVIFTVIFYVLRNDVFAEGEQLFEGVMFTITCIILTWLAFQMLRTNDMKEKWEKKIDVAIRENKMGNIGRGMFFLAFTIVFREGVESVVFIAGVGSDQPTGLILPGILGILAGCLIGYLVHRGSKFLRIGLFFKLTAVFLLFIAAGALSIAGHEFEEYHFEQQIKNAPVGTDTSTYPETTPELWDASGCCSHKTNYFFQILRVFTGYTASPTVVTTVLYFGYWFVVLLAFIIYKFLFAKKMKTQKSSDTLKDKDNEVSV
ncbi:high-affinity iron permease [Clydaea vesicula]|uniref:High-affinity iron permease n=1 Tax=Clydaea vesicula TaxID=447962 RepID=A0AAD5TZB9_9FUNG|nr:high-affinity iron permease [Clydaea vesicula]KAJ3385192.1 high-affinity iron permease [Lobulomyces angularis]